MKQILVVGAGSVGGFFGAHLAKSNPNVSFLLRPRTLAAVRQNGLTVRSAGGTFTVWPPAASDPRELPQPDLIILGVKAYDLDEVMAQIERVMTARTVILTLQNGIDTEDRLIARLKRDCVVGGVAFIYSKIAEPGVIDHYKKGAVAIGELMGHESERVLAIRDLFTSAGIPCQLSKDIRRSKWEKMCWNCVFNPITVLVDDRVAKALEHPEMMRVIHQIVDEITAVAAAVKVPLPPNMPERVVKATQEIRDIHTSMYDDWKTGRRTEIDYLNGYIVRLGRELGIPTPVNEALTAMIKTITEKEQSGPGVVRIDGAVVQPVSLDRAAMQQLPAEHHVEDVGTVMPGMAGRAIKVKGLLDVPALTLDADHVTFHSLDGNYAATLTLQQARDFGLLLYELNGEPLPDGKGGPFRLITPGLGDLCANVKGVGRIEVRVGSGKDTRPTAEERTHC
ncbi:2-dehydropantoate 2-reductase [Nitrospira moscoviensis]|uniref:2-dehydropantoate 2-reductase n=1 Tax=Nitrospira moscoviensis TaxID=42253 RepID=A0A0K2GDD7_NITMO|nr:2-dehydropantoate 2-reductase [Nitrospira moscoviensis]ALA58879.1 2-dehydropantoate 2-reductase [Nitrospira moscoviensis]